MLDPNSMNPEIEGSTSTRARKPVWWITNPLILPRQSNFLPPLNSNNRPSLPNSQNDLTNSKFLSSNASSLLPPALLKCRPALWNPSNPSTNDPISPLGLPSCFNHCSPLLLPPMSRRLLASLMMYGRSSIRPSLLRPHQLQSHHTPVTPPPPAPLIPTAEMPPLAAVGNLLTLMVGSGT